MQPGQPPKRHEVTALIGMGMCRWMEVHAADKEDCEEFKRDCCRRYDQHWRQLERIWSKGLKWWQEKVQRLAVGGGTQGSLNKRGQNLRRASRQNIARGARDVGGGRIDYFVDYKVMLKAWVEEERSNGHCLDCTDLQLQFAWYLKETIKLLEAREAELKIP